MILMRIAMMTNTYVPHVGGVARSVDAFAGRLRRAGHEVLVACPHFEGTEDGEPGIVRVPALEHWQDSDFSLPLPLTAGLHRAVKAFQPDVLHSHHPFLLGDTALRASAALEVPIVFTHHTMYERYTRYVPLPLPPPQLERLAIEVATGYANLCDAVIAPSASLRRVLLDRHVERPVTVVPTGIDTARFTRGDGARWRSDHAIPATNRIVGHVGRLSPEKNLLFLTRCLVEHATKDATVRIAIVGSGPLEGPMRREFERAGLSDRVHWLGALENEALIDAYAAMDVFGFASTTETQGIVLAEAMAAGVPVVALAASGVNEIVRDGVNGRLLASQRVDIFSDALAWTIRAEHHARLSRGARDSARDWSVDRSGERLVAVYERVLDRRDARPDLENSRWATVRRRAREEWLLARHRTRAAAGAWRHGSDAVPTRDTSDAASSTP